MADKDLETQDGAQEKADAAESAAESYADGEIESHRQNETHDTAQPPQSHDNAAHSENFLTSASLTSELPVTGLTETTDFPADNVTLSGSQYAVPPDGIVSLPNNELAATRSFTPSLSVSREYENYEWSDDGETLAAATSPTADREVEYFIYDYPNDTIVQQGILTNLATNFVITPNADGSEVLIASRDSGAFNGKAIVLDRDGNTLNSQLDSGFSTPRDICYGSGRFKAVAAAGDSFAVIADTSGLADSGTWSNNREMSTITTVGQSRENWVAGRGVFGSGLQSGSIGNPQNTNFDGSPGVGTEDLSGFVDSSDFEYAIADENGLAINIDLSEQQRVDSSVFSSSADKIPFSVAVLQDADAVAVYWQDEDYVRFHQRSDLSASAPTAIKAPSGERVSGNKLSKLSVRNGGNFNTFEVGSFDDAVVYIEFDRPGYLFGWDTAVLASETDGTADVTVDLQENDGTGWVTVKQDVPRQTPITSIPPDNDVRLKATLTRSDSADDATIVYAGIRHQK